jgi:hypothetical protein
MPEGQESPADTDKLVEAQLIITLYVDADGKRGVMVMSGDQAPDTFTMLGMLAAASGMLAGRLGSP